MTAAPAAPVPEASKPFWAKCRACAHCWEAAYFPMEMTRFCRIAMRATCPKCGARKPVVARQDDGVLLETVPTPPALEDTAR